MVSVGTYLLPLLLLAVACSPAEPQAVVPALMPGPEPVRVRLLFAGDVMQHLPQVAAARRGDGFDYDATFDAVRPLFEAADLTVVNLETTLSRSGPFTGYPNFRSPTALAGALRRAGVDVACMANNHCCDAGAAGIRTTAHELARCGIRHTGAFADSLDRAVNHPLRLTREGIRFALFNYTYGTNGLPVPEGCRVNVIDTAAMAADLASARDAECRIVCIHWGEEYERRPSEGQRRLAAFLRRHGADIVAGSHPHVVQPFEADSTGIVLYSLGNFVSNQRRRYTDGGILAEVDVERHAEGLRYSLRVIPVWVSLPRFRVLPPDAADTMALPPAYMRFRNDVAEHTTSN